MEKNYFGYIRVSTAKQGEKGVSLQEQKTAIIQHAQRNGLTIVRWFEERESAAKRGRAVFTQMMKELAHGNVLGVIIHKIDRSARNLKDWADLGELIDTGIEVHFANESLDLNTRGGRLSADIQAVVAADYIRNLREETRKGFYGRLKQGFYPLPAPLGYIDHGKGMTKEVDPVTGPLISKLFALYATGQYSLHRLLEETKSLGLRNRRGRMLTLNGLSTILNNPFYTGVIRIRRTAERFAGNHKPLVSASVFDRVQSILRGKTVIRTVRHNFAFRKLVRCRDCGYTLIGELQKSRVYYRCQRQSCPTTAVREDALDNTVGLLVAKLTLDPEEIQYLRGWIDDAKTHERTMDEQRLEGAKLQLDNIRSRVGRLTDAFIDGTIEKPLFDARKATLLHNEQQALETIRNLESGNRGQMQQLEEFLELVTSAPFAYQNAIPDEKRNLVTNLFSNLALSGKNLSVTLKPSVQLLANRPKPLYGSPYRGAHRTWNKILKNLVAHLEHEPIPGEAAA